MDISMRDPGALRPKRGEEGNIMEKVNMRSCYIGA